MEPRLPPAPMISTVSPYFSSATCMSRFHAVGTWRMTTAARESRDFAEWRTPAQAGTATSSAKPPGRLMPIMPCGPVIAAAVLGADVQRHDAGGGDAVADVPAADLRADGIDDAGAIDAGNERQDRTAILLAAGAQADVEHAVDGRGVDLDADFAVARDRVGKVLVAQNVGRAVFVDDDRFHRWSCVMPGEGGAPSNH